MSSSRKHLIDIISEEEKNNIIFDYQNNVSLRQLEKKYQHGRNAIAKMLESLNIKTTKGNHYRKYFCNFDFFDKIDNELSAYWLGFMYADGCVLSKPKYGQQEIKIALAEKDLSHLELFKKDIKSTYPIRWDESKAFNSENSQRQCIQKITSQKLADDLKKLGCVERKTNILTFPTEDMVPKNFQKDFIRGYFDGDGSVTIQNKNDRIIYNINIVGTYEMVSKIQKILCMGQICKEKRSEKNVWYYSLGGNLQVLKFYHYLYDNSTRYMERKYQKFSKLIEKYE